MSGAKVLLPACRQVLLAEEAKDRRIHNVWLVSVNVVTRAFSDDHL
jgi:hypothetical protein